MSYGVVGYELPIGGSVDSSR